MMPRNPLKLESWNEIDNLVPPRKLLSELISFSAALMAISETFPLMVFNVKIAPTFTTWGLEEAASEISQKQKMNIETAQIRYMVIKNYEPHHWASCVFYSTNTNAFRILGTYSK